MPIGDPSYSTKRAKTTWFYLSAKQPALILKVLPPLGSLWQTGQWFKYAAVHWSQPDSNKRRHPFFCVEERSRDRKTITVVCPYCAKNAEIKADYEAKKKAGVAPEYLNTLFSLMLNTGATRGYYMNVMDLNGQFGVLRLPKTGKEALDKEIKSLMNDAIRAIDPIKEGAYFEFSREGAGLGTKYYVRRHEDVIEVNGQRYRDIKCVALTDAQIKAVDTPLFTGRDLDDLAIPLTFDEVELLASGDTKTVDRVFERSKKAVTPEVAEYDGPEESAAEPVTACPAARPVEVVPLAAPAAVVAPIAVPLTSTVKPEPRPGVPVAEASKMTEDQLMSLFKNGGV